MWENNATYGQDRQRFSSGVSAVARLAMRLFACAGVLSTGLLMSGGIAVADTGDATGAEPDAAAVTSKSDDNDSGSGATGASNPEPPSSTFGNGRDGVEVKTGEDDKKNNGVPSATKKFKGAWTIPILRIPRRDELPPSGLPNPELFYTTLVIPVPTLAELFAAAQPQPPTPAPGPTFKTQEESPPVVDAGGGGVNPLSVAVAAEPPVLQVPLVIAPLPIPISAAAPPVAPLGTAAGAAAPAPGAVDVAAVGVRAPVIRGSLPPTTEPANSSMISMTSTSGQPTRLGYPRYLREPTTGELALMALPGLAGLMVLTLSGGFIGYRQANSARMFRAQTAARFLR